MNAAFTATEATTRDRILDAAEALFAEQGFDATSVRAITAAAGVNLAAVNYHFQSKDALVRAVLCRQLEPITRRRLDMLDEVMARAGKGRPELDGILNAMARPVIEAACGPGSNPSLGRLIGRVTSEPAEGVQAVAQEHLRPLAQRFQAALARAVPHLPQQDVMWRMFLSIGALLQLLAAGQCIRGLSGGHMDSSDPETNLRQWIAYARGALLAPPTAGKGV